MPFPPRFLPPRGSPRRALLPPEPGVPAGLPGALLQRYLEHLLLPPPPQLGYEEAVLHPYSYHKVCGPSAVPLLCPRCWGRGGGSAAGSDPWARLWLQFGYQDGAHQLPGGTARQSPETTPLLGRVPAQALFGAGPVPSYGGQPGADGGHLFQDLAVLSLPREKNGRTDPAGTRLPHGLRLPGDLRDVEEREQPAPLAAQPPPAQTGTAPSRLPSRLVQHIPPQTPACCFPSPRALQGSDPTLCPLADASLKRLASLLASYGLGLPELSPQQLSSLSALLQLLQSSGE